MSIIKTPAIVLKCDNYRETSKIVTLYTRTHGKVRCIAKGVRNTKSRWGGALQTMAYLNILFYDKEQRTLNLLSNAEHVCSLNNLFEDYEKMKIGYRIVELVNKMTIDYHENNTLFEILVDVLQNLNDATKNYVNVLFKFEFELAKILGFEIDIEKVNVNNRNGLTIDIDKVKEKRTEYASPDRDIFGLLKSGNFADVIEFNILKDKAIKIDNFLENHFREHIENIGIFKTKKIINS